MLKIYREGSTSLTELIARYDFCLHCLGWFHASSSNGVVGGGLINRNPENVGIKEGIFKFYSQKEMFVTIFPPGKYNKTTDSEFSIQ